MASFFFHDVIQTFISHDNRVEYGILIILEVIPAAGKTDAVPV